MRSSVAFTMACRLYAASRSVASKPATRFHSAMYGDAGSWACRATTRRTASTAGSGSRSSNSWRASVARLRRRAVSGTSPVILNHTTHGTALPVGGDWADLDGTAVAGGRDRRRQRDGCSLVLDLQHQVAADGALGAEERAVLRYGLAVDDLHSLGVGWQAQRKPRRHGVVAVEGGVVGVDLLLLGGGQRLPRVGVRQWGGALVDEQCELHGLVSFVVGRRYDERRSQDVTVPRGVGRSVTPSGDGIDEHAAGEPVGRPFDGRLPRDQLEGGSFCRDTLPPGGGPMTTPRILEPQCEWTAADVADEDRWTERFTDAELAELDASLRHALKHSDDVL